jgi:heme oxygenase (biliverdin-IX-beta and delta-forming)
MSSLLARIRSETRPFHERLERQMILMRPDLSLARYRDVLEAFHGFYKPWEAAIFPLLDSALPASLASRRKLPLLEEDIRALGGSPESVACCPDLPSTGDLALALGSMYVLEGSTLGGQIISRHLARRFCFPKQGGCRFFTAYGPETGRMWREFGAILENQSGPEFDDQAVSSACATFAKFHAWFAKKGVLEG